MPGRVESTSLSLALARIREEQREPPRFVLPLPAIAGLVAAIGEEFCKDVEWEPRVFEVVALKLEGHLVRLLEDANLSAIHAQRYHITPSDLQITRRLRRNGWEY